MGSSLKSFIKDVRNAKTLADERTIITKQSAKIRTKLRDDHLPFSKRRVNIQKLLYLYIMGEKTHFGQVECINLIASDNFVDKRLGYLAAMLLLDETQDLLTLLTNLLSNDLHHPNKYVISMALTTLGSLSSNGLARDLYPDVVNIIETSTDAFILKKALQCISKLIVKDDDFTLLEIFPIDIINKKFLYGNFSLCTHGVWLGLCKAIQSLIINFKRASNKSDYNSNETFIKSLQDNLLLIIPNLFNKLSSLNSKNLEPNYDVQGIQDPFLQCELIVTLKWIFKISNNQFPLIITKYNDKFNDLLTILATNSSNDLSKSPSNAILYEITRTIFELNFSQPLRILGVNILANFLKNGNGNSKKINNNIKYVALNTLIDVVKQEPSAIERHKKFISQCLYDPDISIKFRALELTFAILNRDNLIDLINELIKFLENVSTNSKNFYYTSYIDLDDSKQLIIYTVDNLIKKFDLYSPDQESIKLQNLFKMLKLVGNIINLDRVNDFLITINNVENWNQKIDILSKLLNNSSIMNNNNISWNLVMIWSIGEYGDLLLNKNGVVESTLTNFLISANKEYHDNITLIQYILTASLKLSSKISNSNCIEQLRQILVGHSRDSNLIIQLKSTQYELIFKQPQSVKKSILNSMPKFERKLITTDESDNNNNSSNNTLLTTDSTTTKGKQQNTDLLLDLLTDISDGTSNVSTVTKVPAVNNNTNNNTNGNSNIDIMLPTNAELVFENPLIKIYSVKLDLGEGSAHFEFYYQNQWGPITQLKTLFAVPKTQKVTLGQILPNSIEILSNKITKQSIKIAGSGKLKLRIKVSMYDQNNEKREYQFDHKYDRII